MVSSPEAQIPLADFCEPERASLFWTFLTWVLVVVCLGAGTVVAVPVGLLARLLGDRHGKIAHACVRTAFRAIIKLHPRYRFTLVGRENLPEGAAVWCPNHQSLADVVYLSSLPGHYKWIIKKELFRVPAFGAAMRVAGYPAIDRGDPKSAAALLERARAYLGANLAVLSFPEGTRSHNGEMGRFQSGAARIAVASQVPLVPIGVVGTARLLPRGKWSYPSRAHLCIAVGKPIATEGATQRDVRALTRELRARVWAARAEAARVVGQSSRVSPAQSSLLASMSRSRS